MFAALCENPEFFRNKMKCYIAMAPVVRLSNLTSPRINKLKHDINAKKALKLLGPELFWRASSADFVSGAVTKSFLGEIVSEALMRESSDDKPELISKKALINMCKFFPAGCSYQ